MTHCRSARDGRRARRRRSVESDRQIGQALGRPLAGRVARRRTGRTSTHLRSPTPRSFRVRSGDPSRSSRTHGRSPAHPRPCRPRGRTSYRSRAGQRSMVGRRSRSVPRRYAVGRVGCVRGDGGSSDGTRGPGGRAGRFGGQGSPLGGGQRYFRGGGAARDASRSTDDTAASTTGRRPTPDVAVNRRRYATLAAIR
jgi:hypothetical protein